MSISTKGRRTIVVEGTPYYWKAKSDAQYAPQTIKVVIYRGRGEGQLVVVKLRVKDDGCDPHRSYQLRPAKVEEMIKKALSEGWKPESDCKNIEWEEQVEVNDRITRVYKE